jgi:hypothetical protein
MITHRLLDVYEAAAGDPERVPPQERDQVGPDWTRLDELLLDLHMVRHGYTTDGYARHLERATAEACADASVVERLKALRL